MWTETPTGGTPNFLTGAGGWLQTAFFGYSGLRINDANQTDDASTPELTSVIGLRGIAYLGSRLDVRIDFGTRQVSVVVQAAPPAAEVDARGVPPSADPLALAPRLPLSRRSQRGQVVLGSGRHVVTARALELVDDAGGVHALAPGRRVTLPLQRVTVRAAA